MNRTLPGARRIGRHRLNAALPAMAVAGPAAALTSRSRRRKSTLAVVFSTVLALGVAAQLHVLTPGGGQADAATANIQPLVAGKTLSGVVGTGGQSAVNAFGNWRGKPADVVVNYIGGNSWAAMTNVSGEGLTHYWDGSTAHRVWSVPLLPLDYSSTLEEAAAGDFWSKYQQIAQGLIAGGDGYSTIRLGWEMTGNWYPWSGQKDPAAYAGAFRAAVNAMRAVPGAHFTFDWNISMGFSDPTNMYPGNAYVDIIGADEYDYSWASSYPASDHTAVWNAVLNQSWGLNWLSAFAKAHGKRMSFPEWGLSYRCDGHGGGDDTYFVQQMHAWIASHDVAYESYFNTNDDSCHRFTITSNDFPNAAYTYKSLFKSTVYYGGGSSTPPPVTPPTTKPPVAPPTTKPPVAPPTTAAPSGSLAVSSIRASGNSSRTNDWELNGSTNAGWRYIFVDAPSNTTSVKFYLDRAVSAGPTHTEAWAPWDLEGETGTAANKLDLGTTWQGTHTLTVQATLSTGAVETATATFYVN